VGSPARIKRSRIRACSVASANRGGATSSRHQHAEADRFPVQISFISSGRLDGMTERMAEIQQGAQIVFALVLGDHLALISQARPIA